MAKPAPIRIQLPDSAIHGQAPLQLLRSKLPTIPKLLFAVLWTYGFRDREEPEISQIANECSCSVSGIRRGIRILEWTGWIRTHLSSGRSHPNIYYPLYSPDIALGHSQFSEYLLRKERVSLGRKTTPWDAKTTPWDHKDTPSDAKATPSDHKTTLREWEGLELLEKRLRREIRAAAAASPSQVGVASKGQAAKAAQIDSQTPQNRSRTALQLPPVVRRSADGAPYRWEAWSRYLALYWGFMGWAWTRQQVAAANQITHNVPPGALHDFMRNVSADEYLRVKRGLDLRRAYDDINKFMPKLARPLRQPALPAAAVPAETEAERLNREGEDRAAAEAYERFKVTGKLTAGDQVEAAAGGAA